ncbi:MAG: hypothetical protein IKB86_03265 [Clostridia bacterium]|nr:hypothetical protein [Clostridia bacterium]
MLLKSEDKRKKELCSFVNKEFERRSKERLPFELQWQLNINFFLGNQYCDILPEAGEIFQQEKAFLWQEREVYNHIAPIIESRLAKLNKVAPRVVVRAATNDEEDVQAAKVSSAILASAFQRNNMSATIKDATMWSELCGTVFYKQGWVNNKGMTVGKDASGANIREGDVSTVVCPPYEIYPDSQSVQDIQECSSVIHAHVYPCEFVRQLYGKEVKPTETDVLSAAEFGLSGGFGTRNTLLGLGEKKAENSCLVLEYYEQESVKHPEGRYIVVSGDTLLFEGELPYVNGEGASRKLPFVQQNSVSRPGCLWGISVVERCIPIQRSYNAVRNRKHELLNRSAVGVLAVEEGSADVEDLAENGLAPGKVIVYRQGADKPEMMYPGTIPDEFTREESALLEEFNLISGTSDLMRQSVAPTNVTSGTALNTIAEQDDTRLAVTADKMRDAVLVISRQWLRLFKQFASYGRIERVVGKNGKVSSVYWTGNMLTSDDVAHETENELSDSLSNRKQVIFDLLGKGLFLDEHGNLPQRTKGRILRALGMGDWENIADLSEIHSSRAQRENVMLKDAKEVVITDTDDHAIHIAEHAKVLLSEEFEEQFGLFGDVRKRFEEHISIHKARMEENDVEQAQ